MIEKAIAKINAEMQKDPSNTYVEIIGLYLIDRCTDDLTAARIGAEGKSLDGVMKAIEGETKKHRKGNVAVLPPNAVVDVVDDYFGLSRDEDARITAMFSARGASRKIIQPPAPGKVSLALDDFL